ncbi:MAG: hypothetical protein ACJ8EL_11385 [Rhizomicrobium sp.]|jgi:hypothetical protein
MFTKFFAPVGTVAVLFLAAGCVGGGYQREAWVPGPMIEEPPLPDQMEPYDPGYRVMPKPKPHRALAAGQHEGPSSNSEIASNKPKKAGAAAASSQVAATPTQKPTVEKPLTPAEIRAAVPAQKVGNPKQTLSTAQIKSLWGDDLGRVHSVDVSDGKLKSVDANVVAVPGAKPKVVRIDPARLKYVRSRNLLLTTMSKPDLERLPKADTP